MAENIKVYNFIISAVLPTFYKSPENADNINSKTPISN
jgi:hypothetical protein